MSLIKFGWFKSHSRIILPWKIDCDALSQEDFDSLARLIAGKFAFRGVIGIPNGGLKLANACDKFAEPNTSYPILIVDDVLTTGESMNKIRETTSEHTIGVVIFARNQAFGRCPNWVWPIFTVNEWAQSRATGLG